MTALNTFLKTVGFYRAVSRGEHVTGEVSKNADRLDKEACAYFVENMTPEVLYEISETMGKHIPPGHPDNHIMFAIRCGISELKARKQRSCAISDDS